ncbi:isoprenoid synthase domain-containing protein [Desarmillaria tabescens]|uniref:Isoprenoid synthase domain-containing protein n=1 Tax=Armillaria tabescens TaxID=1929756 RepID=A0AA39JJ36_ARMTA|nr:isoprenoid synthase domain-containing protein [Desarmillaria tabescens]KAK0442254.1 isoprenoid synthase domain-containing protein [Desarmillaria tabescens]
MSLSPENTSLQHQGVQPQPSSLSGHVKSPNPTGLQQTTECIIRSFLHQFDTTSLPSVSNPALEDLCMKEAERRGYALDALRPYLVTSLNITASAYHHLEDLNVKVYIVMFTAFAIYFDDAYPDDPDALVGVPNFTKYFASLEKQPNKMLDDFAKILAETSQLFGETHKVDRYAIYLRELSGLAEAYAVFIFPTEMPYTVYVQALPLLRDVINFINDITSFYKEECDGDNHNLISMLAEANGEAKTKALCYLTEKCMEAHKRTLLILSPHKEAHEMYKEFVKGYLAYHLGAKRYRLNELNI